MESFSNDAFFQFFSTLASRTRLAIIDVLEGEPKTLSEVSDKLKQEKEIVLNNLEQLEKSFLINSENTGKVKKYSLNKEIIAPLSEILTFHVNKHCPGLKECIPPQKLKEYMKKEAEKPTYIEHE